MDGTLIDDNNFHLGHQKNWKGLVKILPGVVDGIKLLRKKFPKAKFFIATSQSGVAIKNFPRLTKKKSVMVCEYVLNLLKSKGAPLDGFELCGHVSPNYTKRRSSYEFVQSLVCGCNCIKPRIGMIENILAKNGWNLDETKIVVIGDRYTDVKFGLNANGFGVLVPLHSDKKEVAKIKRFINAKDKKKMKIVDDFFLAAEMAAEFLT